jgi:hypothetical protein
VALPLLAQQCTDGCGHAVLKLDALAVRGMLRRAPVEGRFGVVMLGYGPRKVGAMPAQCQRNARRVLGYAVAVVRVTGVN